jgi:DNA polymerase I
MKPDGCYTAVTNEADLRDLAYVLSDFGTTIGLDTETTGVDYLTCELVGISITHRAKFGKYIPVKRHVKQVFLWDNSDDYLPIDMIAHYLNPILSDPNKIKILHNAKFDMHVLHRHGFDLQQPIFDTMIGAWVLGNIHGARFGLKDLAKRKLGYEMTEFKDLVGKKGTFDDVPLKDATAYAACDSDMTLRLYELEVERFKQYPTLIPTLELEQPCVEVLKKMEEVGAMVDQEYLKSLSKPLGRQMKNYEDFIYRRFGVFNINSHDELIDKINRHLGLKLEDAQFDTIVKYKDDHPVLDAYLRWAKRQKLKSVYVDGVLKLVNGNSRVHTEFKQNKKTGRISSNNPNLQNIPTKKDDDEYKADLPELRQSFMSGQDKTIVSIDYSQLELRIMAHIAGEDAWIAAFNSGVDIHEATAKAMFKVDRVNKDQRKAAKTINFGLLYLMTEFGLSKKLKCTIDEAKEFIDKFFENLPMIKQYMVDRKNEVVNRKYVETEMGRRLYFNYDLSNPKALPASIREGTNLPIQGLAADIVKKAMLEVDKLLDNYYSKMILQVHDELVIEAVNDEMPVIIPKIRDIMENIYRLDVPLVVDCEVGANWGQLRNYV